MLSKKWKSSTGIRRLKILYRVGRALFWCITWTRRGVRVERMLLLYGQRQHGSQDWTGGVDVRSPLQNKKVTFHVIKNLSLKENIKYLMLDFCTIKQDQINLHVWSGRRAEDVTETGLEHSCFLSWSLLYKIFHALPATVCGLQVHCVTNQRFCRQIRGRWCKPGFQTLAMSFV